MGLDGQTVRKKYEEYCDNSIETFDRAQSARTVLYTNIESLLNVHMSSICTAGEEWGRRRVQCLQQPLSRPVIIVRFFAASQRREGKSKLRNKYRSILFCQFSVCEDGGG